MARPEFTINDAPVIELVRLQGEAEEERGPTEVRRVVTFATSIAYWAIHGVLDPSVTSL